MRTLNASKIWYFRAFIGLIILSFFLPLPFWLAFVPLVMFYLIPSPNADLEAPRHVQAPVTGRWVAVNSPASKVPSHIRLLGQSHAIDILRSSQDEDEQEIGWALAQRSPETFECFGDPVHAVQSGTVIAVKDGRADHRSRTTGPGLIYMMSVEAFARQLGGTSFIMGNHVIVEHANKSYAVYAHLQRGSVAVQVGEELPAGHVLGLVGNSGNTSEPHLHFQLMDRPRTEFAAGLPFRWDGIKIHDAISKRWSGGRTPERTIQGLPANGQFFDATASS